MQVPGLKNEKIRGKAIWADGVRIMCRELQKQQYDGHFAYCFEEKRNEKGQR